MKFGGASVATPQHFSRIAELIAEKKADYQKIITVVSAMGNMTDELIALAKMVHPDPPRREYDMLVTVGERISISLLAMALARQNQSAVSYTGSQCGIITTPDHCEARIVDVRPHRLVKCLDQGKVAIVAGFQGVSTEGEITTLGRGGSDTTAVALGIALKAAKVEFYKDVAGIYRKDPKLHPGSELIRELTFEQALKVIRDSGGVLHPRCVELAAKNGLPLHVRSFCKETYKNEKGTIIQEATQQADLPPLYE